MTDSRLQNMAKILVEYSTKLRKDDWVVILAEPHGLPLAREITRQATLTGAHVDLVLHDRTFDEIVLKNSSEEQLQWVTPLLDLVVRKADVLIQIMAPENTRTLSGVDPVKQKLTAQVQHKIMKIYHQRIQAGELRWNITQAPCPALAQEADMSLADFEDFVYAACFADQDDPVARWRQVEAEQERLVRWLAGRKQIKIQSAHADLTLSIEGRTFNNSTATVNLPSGEIYTSPVEDSAEGWVEFTYPAIRLGREVEGVRLEFEKGRVVRATAVKNEEYLLQMLEVDEGARYLGELGIGSNYGIQRFTKSILFDEKIGGTFHLAIGNGFPETGGKNQSSIHWDFICDARAGGRMWADGELFYQDGRFVI